jgi:predicted neuraminidase
MKHKTVAGALVSKDRGESWEPHGELLNPKTWLIEGTVAMLSNNHVMQLFRTSNNSIYRSVSPNSGVTWSDAKPIGIPNPDSKINVLHLKSKSNSDLALAFNDNPLREGKHVRFDRGRNRLRIALSNDDGRTWTRVALLELGDNKHYYHYPTMHQDGCRLLVVYSVMQARPAQQKLHGVGGIMIAEINLKGHVDCSCDLPPQ